MARRTQTLYSWVAGITLIAVVLLTACQPERRRRLPIGDQLRSRA